MNQPQTNGRPARIVTQGVEARQAIGRGVDILANAVGATLGPAGRFAVIEEVMGIPPVVTKDGVTVAKAIHLSDPLERLGADLVKSVAQKTVDVSGDGTTTATVLAQAIYTEGLKAITVGANPVALRSGIELATKVVCEELAKMSTPVTGTMLAQVGTISSNNDAAIGALIAEAMEKAGKDGVVAMGDSSDFNTTLEVIEGMQFDSGYVHEGFVTDTRRDETTLENVFILMFEKKLSCLSTAKELLNQVRAHQGTFLVIAEDIDADALGTLALNHGKGILKSCAVRIPGHPLMKAAMLQDIAALVGGTPITSVMDLKIEQVTLAHLGHADKVTVSRHNTLITGGAGTGVEMRVIELKGQIERSVGNELDLLKQRLARLAGGVSIIKVGGFTDAEVLEKKYRIEDAMHATRCAQEEGIVPGGGTALAKAASALDYVKALNDEKIGVEIIRKACYRPLCLIASNAGKQGAVVLEKVLDSDYAEFGYNALTDSYEHLVNSGVIDPTKVVRSALQHASSIASLMLVTEALVTEERK
jgi:chaperonin GroEL